MGGYFSSLFSEMGARRKRLRAALGDRGQALCEFLVMGGLLVGSLGLFVRAWMPAAAPWGFWLPLGFVSGYFVIEARRQGELSEGAPADRVASLYDWATFLWGFGCALAGAAAFAIAWSAAPPAPPQEQIWTPPQNAVPADISPRSR
jgi:hypothetical protein